MRLIYGLIFITWVSLASAFAEAAPQFVLVPGYMWNSPTRAHLRGPAFEDLIEVLVDRGIPYFFVATHGQASITKDTDKIVETVSAAPGPVVLVGHSRGGLEVLEALRVGLSSGQIDVQKLLGVILISSPLTGNPGADLIIDNAAATRKILNPFTGFFGKLVDGYQLQMQNRVSKTLFGTDLTVVREMSTPRLKEYFDRHEDFFKLLIEKVPIVTFAGHFDQTVPKRFSSYPFPGARHVEIDTDHAGFVQRPTGEEKQERDYEGFVDLLLQVLEQERKYRAPLPEGILSERTQQAGRIESRYEGAACRRVMEETELKR